MPSVVYVAPSAPLFLPPLPYPWPGLGQMWEGWDSSRWDLTGSDFAGIALQPGVRGLTMPGYERFASTSSAVAGSRHHGSRARERGVFWPARIYSDVSSQEWLAFDRAFWATMDPDKPGTWTVTQPGTPARPAGETRSLRCRFVDDGEHAFDIDPSLIGWALYGITLVADDPYWRGTPVVARWPGTPPVDFFDAGGSPPFHIAEGSDLAAASIANPGDVDGWLTWWVGAGGTGSACVLGVGTTSVVVPFEVPADRLLVVSSDPTTRTAREIDAPPLVDGLPMPDADQEAWVAAHLPTALDRTKDLGASTRWGSVTPGAAVALSVSRVGTGDIRAALIPGFRRAW